jgi:hypothetical protein
MVEIRKSTWVLLGVMCVLIFAPLFFINVEGLPGSGPGQQDNSVHPSVTHTQPKPKSNQHAGNREPPTNEPAGNEPDRIDPN